MTFAIPARWTFALLEAADPETVVPLAEVKKDLDVTFNDDDSLIAAHRTAAIRWVENYTNRFLGPTRLRFISDRLEPAQPLPFAPLISVETITVGGTAMAGFRTILGEPGMAAPLSGQPWPSYVAQPGAVEIDYTVGYPAGQVDPLLIQGVKLMTSVFYDKPAPFGMAGSADAQNAAENLIHSMRYVNIA